MEKLSCKFEKYKHGFTLAEVLITLVIIGVVAALVISTLINTYVESSTVAKVKKGLSILGQAKKLAEAQNGSIEGWDFGVGATTENAALFWNYLKPHIAVTKDCGSNSDCYQSNGIYELNGNYHDNYNTDSRYYKFVLSDGSVMWFNTFSSKCNYNYADENLCAQFFYDVNGDKKPNTIGRDVFLFSVTSNGVTPSLSYSCTKNSIGWGCAAYIIQHNNMKYLH